jgi:hypothetical protein
VRGSRCLKNIVPNPSPFVKPKSKKGSPPKGKGFELKRKRICAKEKSFSAKEKGSLRNRAEILFLIYL